MTPTPEQIAAAKERLKADVLYAERHHLMSCSRTADIRLVLEALETAQEDTRRINALEEIAVRHPEQRIWVCRTDDKGIYHWCGPDWSHGDDEDDSTTFRQDCDEWMARRAALSKQEGAKT